MPCAAGYWYIVTARSTASFFPPATVFLRLVWVRLFVCNIIAQGVKQPVGAVMRLFVSCSLSRSMLIA